VRQALPRPTSRESATYLELLSRRLAGLRAVAGGRRADWMLSGRERGLARRFVERFAGCWDDGDETLVRGFIDRWLPPGEKAGTAAAAALLEAADALARHHVRAATLWFFLWEMESVVAGLAADKPAGP